MKNCIALLRGVNISGKNKVPMAELKKTMTEYGFLNVKTYLNSGNISFLSDIEDKNTVSKQINALINDRFNLDIPVFVIHKDELEDILANTPEWWGRGDAEIYDNIIFLIFPLTVKDFYNEIGELKEEYEKAEAYKNTIFWSFDRKNYRKTNWWAKTANLDLRSSITIHTANTVKKLITK